MGNQKSQSYCRILVSAFLALAGRARCSPRWIQTKYFTFYVQLMGLQVLSVSVGFLTHNAIITSVQLFVFLSAISDPNVCPSTDAGVYMYTCSSLMVAGSREIQNRDVKNL